jgi:hypothetical protein
MRASTIIMLLVAAVGVPAVAAADQSAASLVVRAQFSSRTSLKVSARVLQFAVAEPGQVAQAVVEFSAGARTGTGSEVVLSVDASRTIDGPGGAADVDTALSFTGEGAGTLGGDVSTRSPTVAGRWSGSGLRSGRLVFSLRAGAAGTYVLPVRFVLSAP